MKTSTVYLLHFERPYKHARHYLGSCNNLARRLAEHKRGAGARLTAVVQAAGISWQCVRTWRGGRQRERQIKKQGGLSRVCPVCNPPKRKREN